MTLDIIRTDEVFQGAFRHICESGNNLTLPYHNMGHLLFVFQNCYEASEYYRLDEIIGENTTRDLCVAALFHDFNHSGGKKSDEENINDAIQALDSWLATLKFHNIEPINRDNVVRYIKATQFPYDVNQELDIAEKIIRDADMLTATNDDDFQKTIFGLRDEFGTKTVLDQVTTQINFILSTKMNTIWAKEKWDMSIGATLTRLYLFKAVLEGKRINVREDDDFPSIELHEKEEIDDLDNRIQEYLKKQQ